MAQTEGVASWPGSKNGQLARQQKWPAGQAGERPQKTFCVTLLLISIFITIGINTISFPQGIRGTEASIQ